MKRSISVSLSAAAYLSIAMLAHASTLVGSQVTLTGDYPTLGTALSNSVTQTVPATFTTSEFTVSAGFFLFGFNTTVGATTIDIAFTGAPGGTTPSVAFDGYVFNFAGAPAITGVSLDPASTFTSSQVGLGFGSNDVTVNLEGQSVTSSSVILVDLTLAGTTSAVPEPGTLSLLGAGIVAVGVFRRRKAV